jgi:hypothetical protein
MKSAMSISLTLSGPRDGAEIQRRRCQPWLEQA